MRKIEIAGVQVNVGSQGELLLSARELVGRGGCIVTPNPHILSRALSDRALRFALCRADLSVPDGNGLRFAFRRAGVKSEILSGVELGERLLASGTPSLALIGGEPGVSDAALAHLCDRFPNVRPAFAVSGYHVRERDICELLKRYSPDLVYIGMGSPRQELFASRLHAAFPKVVFLSLGGSLDVYAGKVKRAPRLFRALHIEWLWRSLAEPKRIPKLFAGLPFFFAVFGEKRKID